MFACAEGFQWKCKQGVGTLSFHIHLNVFEELHPAVMRRVHRMFICLYTLFIVSRLLFVVYYLWRSV